MKTILVNAKSLIWLSITIVAMSSVRAADRMSTAELKGEWVVISCPKDEVTKSKAWTIALRTDTITSMCSVQALRGDAVNSDAPYPVDIEITSSELSMEGTAAAVSRRIRIPAGTNETAPGFLAKLVGLIDDGRRRHGN